jgi:hypothetical protein
MTNRPDEIGDELRSLELLRHSLIKGDFSVVLELVPLMKSQSRDLRVKSAQLFADVCSHDQVSQLDTALAAAADPDETNTAVSSLGKTLSAKAIPLLWRFRKEEELPLDFDGYFHTALTTILPLDQVNEYTFDDHGAEEACLAAARKLDPAQYYFRGEPVFVGDFTKKVITQAVIANKEKSTLKLSFEPTLLSNFSGIACPIRYGVAVTDDLFRRLLEYTKLLAAMDWRKGMKYYYGHPVQ